MNVNISGIASNIAENQLCSIVVSCEYNYDSVSSQLSISHTTTRMHVADVPFGETTPMSQVSKFFCSMDTYLDNMNDWEIYDSIQMKYPGLSINEQNESVRKKAIIDMVQDEQFINDILSLYDMNILDFFRFMFRLCPSLFKGLFLKRIQSIVADKQYAKSIRFGNYTFKRKDQDFK